MSVSGSIIVLSAAFLVLSGAICLIFLGRKGHWSLPLAGGGLLLLLFVSIFFYPFTMWAFDALVGWELRCPVDTVGYKVALVQKPGVDFYNSYFEVTRPDGKKSAYWIDGDDNRWWNANVAHEDGKLYFVRGLGAIETHTPYVDPVNNILSTGYKTCKIAELEFK